MFIQMRNAAKRSHQYNTPSPPDLSSPVMMTSSHKEPPIPETEVPMQVDHASGAPCELFGNFLVGECSHTTGDSLISPPHSANHDLCHLKQTFGPQNVRRRNCPGDNEVRPPYTTLDPKTKFDQVPCRVTALCYHCASDDLLLADAANAKVKRFNSQGQLKVEYIIPSNYGELLEPCGLSCLPSGEIVVADSGAGDIKVFTPEGHFLTSFGRDLDKPCDVTVNRQGHVIVVEESRNNIHVYQKFGNEEATTFCGDVEGQTLTCGPRSVTVSSNGNIVVGDVNSKSIIIYDSFGKFLSIYTSEDPVQKGSVRRPKSLVSSYSLGHLKLPAAIADDHHGNVFVLDAEHARVSQFDLNKNIFVREVVSREDGLHHPRCMAANDAGKLVITEDECQLVKIYDAREALGW